MDVPGEKLILKMWESLVDKGIGSLLKPWQICREGRAMIDVRRGELLALTQAELEATAIRSRRKILLPNGALADNPLYETARLLPEPIANGVVALQHIQEAAEQMLAGTLSAKRLTWRR